MSELGRIDPAAVMDRYGLTPAQYPDFAALRGDPSDNLPSIPGVGEKTAAKWVREFGSLAELIDRVDEVKGKAGDALRAHLANVLLNRQLTELVRDVAAGRRARPTWPCGRGTGTRCTGCSTSWSSGCCASGCSPRCRAPSRRPRAASRCRAARSAPGAVRAWLDAHARDGRRVGLAFARHHRRGHRGDLAGIGLACGRADGRGPGGRRGGGRAEALPRRRRLTPDDEAALGEWLADPAVPKAAHDAKAALHALRGRGWTLAGLTSDTALAAYLSRPGQRTFDLADLALRYLRRELRVDGEAEDEPASSSLRRR